MPVSALAGALRVGASGAVLDGGGGGTNPATQAGRAGCPRQRRCGVAGDVGEAGAGALVEVPGAQQAGLAGRDLGVLGGIDLGQAARRAPDPDLVDDAREEAGGGACGGPGTADRGQCVLVSALAGWLTARVAVEDAVEIEVPGRPVIGRGRMVPDVAGDDGVAGDRVIEARTVAARTFLEVGRRACRSRRRCRRSSSRPRRSVSASARPLVMSGMVGHAARAGARADTGARPLEPQLQGEGRAAQVGRGPSVAYWFVPLSWRAVLPVRGGGKPGDPGGPRAGAAPRQRRCGRCRRRR